MDSELASPRRRRDLEDSVQVDEAQVKSEVQWKVLSGGKNETLPDNGRRRSNALMAAQTKVESIKAPNYYDSSSSLTVRLVGELDKESFRNNFLTSKLLRGDCINENF
ncbi:hypothetical protein MRX96_017060 [Rhipicephalus microplus]